MHQQRVSAERLDLEAEPGERRTAGLEGLGFAGIGEVRAGKVIELDLAETDPAKAKAQAEEMARRLLANTVIESYRIEVA